MTYGLQLFCNHKLVVEKRKKKKLGEKFSSFVWDGWHYKLGLS